MHRSSKTFEHVNHPGPVAGRDTAVEEEDLAQFDRRQLIPALQVGQFFRCILTDTVRAIATGHDHQIKIPFRNPAETIVHDLSDISSSELMTLYNQSTRKYVRKAINLGFECKVFESNKVEV